jgi:hypothetical protein
MSVTYEWLAEDVDEYGDVIEVHHFDTFAEAMKHVSPHPYQTQIGVVRDRGNDVEGLIDRQWAYLDEGKLPVRFSYGGGEEGPLVPARFHNEVKRAKS